MEIQRNTRSSHDTTNWRDAKLIRVGQEILIPDERRELFRRSNCQDFTGSSAEAPGSRDFNRGGGSVSVYREQGIELFQEKGLRRRCRIQESPYGSTKDIVAREYSYQSSFEIAMAFFGMGNTSQRGSVQGSQEYRSDCPKCDVYVRKSEDLYKEMHYKKACSIMAKSNSPRPLWNGDGQKP